MDKITVVRVTLTEGLEELQKLYDDGYKVGARDATKDFILFTLVKPGKLAK